MNEMKKSLLIVSTDVIPLERIHGAINHSVVHQKAPIRSTLFPAKRNVYSVKNNEKNL